MNGFKNDNQNSEESAIETLILLSDDTKDDDKEFDDFVTSGWDEVSCGWRSTKPNAHFVVSFEKRKRSKEKLQISPEPDSQLAKVKKLAGMIAHSNLHRDGNSSTIKLKSNSALMKYQNCGVLSYDIPCWRFVIDPKQYHYIERPSFLELRSISDRRTNTTHTILLENGGMISCQEINGRMALFDPALSFDKHLIDTYIEREEFRLKACQRPVNCSLDYTTKFSQTRKEDNKIHVTQTLSFKPLEPCNSVCEMCRHRTQELEKTESKSISGELKPLLKVTPTLRRVAEDSRLAGKVLLHQSKSKDLSLKTIKGSRRIKNSLNSRHSGMRLDWLPITRSTIAYPYVDTMTGNERVSNDKFPDHASQGTNKSFVFPRGHPPKARKLTLSEAANLVPKTSKLGHAIDKLAKELEGKQDKPLSLTEPILPSVSGTKLEVSLSGCLSGCLSGT